MTPHIERVQEWGQFEGHRAAHYFITHSHTSIAMSLCGMIVFKDDISYNITLPLCTRCFHLKGLRELENQGKEVI